MNFLETIFYLAVAVVVTYLGLIALSGACAPRTYPRVKR